MPPFEGRPSRSTPPRGWPSAYGPRGSMRGPEPSPMKRGSRCHLGVGKPRRSEILADGNVAKDDHALARVGGVGASLDCRDLRATDVGPVGIQDDDIMVLGDRNLGGVPRTVVDQAGCRRRARARALATWSPPGRRRPGSRGRPPRRTPTREPGGESSHAVQSRAAMASPYASDEPRTAGGVRGRPWAVESSIS